MEKKIDISKNYEKYKTLSILPSESVAEYEYMKAPEPVDGAHIQASLTISFEEAVTGTEKKLDIVVDGKQRRILVKIPAGIKNGTPIRYKEKGEVGKHGGRRGDLYVNVHVLPQVNAGLFEDIFGKTFGKTFGKGVKSEQNTPSSCEVNLTFMEAAKGTEKEVQIADMRKIKVKIPAGIDDGQKLRLKVADKKESDEYLYVKVNVDKHPKLQRKGYDVYSTELIPDYIGSGRVVGIETVGGTHYYAVTKNIKDGMQICLRNKGIPKLKAPTERGDHYVTWKRKKSAL